MSWPGGPALRSAALAAVLGAALASAGAAPAAAQDLARTARAEGAHGVRLAFPARPNVCGAGDWILVREPDGTTSLMSGRLSRGDWQRWREGDAPCETGDVQLRMRRQGVGFGEVRLWIAPTLGGGVEPRPGDEAAGPVIDLGYVAGQPAADFLLAEARRAPERAAREMVLAASLAADATTWPALLEMARDASLPRGTRKAALHWLGRQAAAEAIAGVDGIVRDRTEADEIREAAVFALSQLPDDRGVPLLIDVIRTVDDARVRSRALFWLADSEDPRALAVFEEILRGPGA